MEKRRRRKVGKLFIGTKLADMERKEDELIHISAKIAVAINPIMMVV